MVKKSLEATIADLAGSFASQLVDAVKKSTLEELIALGTTGKKPVPRPKRKTRKKPGPKPKKRTGRKPGPKTKKKIVRRKKKVMKKKTAKKS